MTLTEQINDIRGANENGKLVIFVGSGVSINSGLPSWNDLVEKFAEELDKCESCCCPPINKCQKKSQKKTNITQEDYLKIPEYYYDCHSLEEYKTIVKKCFNKSAKPNPIDDIILRLNPHHIITTNYDHLLEDSEEPNRRLYSVITTDEGLLSPGTSQYIIKMHGDINDPKNIVLKESDYINYSQNHVFIETLIKSLLIDHVFLFVGYSFSDYNLKLILGWVNYLAERNEISKGRQNYYLIQTQSEIKLYALKYFTKNHIQILDANGIPQKIIDHALSELDDYWKKKLDEDDCGKRVYACLDYIYDESYDFQLDKLEDTLNEKYQILDDYHWISSQDLLSAYSFGGAKMIGRSLKISNSNIYNEVISILKNTSDKAEFIKKIFLKTGILEILNDSDSYPLSEAFSSAQNIEEKLFRLYLNNQYDELCSLLKDSEDKAVSDYYFWLCAPQKKKHNELMEELKKEIPKGSVIDLLFFTYNSMQLGLGKDYTVHRTRFNKILKILSPKQERITEYLPEIINIPAKEFQSYKIT